MFLASVPDKPLLGPVSDSTETSDSLIKLNIASVDGDGGLPILAYELQMGSVTLNDFSSVSDNSLQTYYYIAQINKG